jgi:cytochrome c biogenesis protein CcmG/thiol:disulfide interchange protein DsbE
MKILSLSLGLMTLVCASAAEPPTKLNRLAIGSKIYTNVTIIGANETDLYFSHSGGFENVKLKYLSPDLQRQFNFNSNVAATVEQRRQEDQASYASSVASAIAAQARDASAGLTSTNGSALNLADPISDKSLLGKRAPALQVEKWMGEKPELEGKPMLLVFWAPGSAACRKCIPGLNALQKKFAEKLVLLGLTPEPEGTVMAMTEPKLEFSSAIDTQARTSTAAGVTSIPCVLLVDAAGTVRYQGHPAAITEAYLQAWLGKPAEQ